jgi:hypothetical protein
MSDPIDQMAQQLMREYYLSHEDAMLVLDVFALDDLLTNTAEGRKVHAQNIASGLYDPRPSIEQLTEEYPQFATPRGQAVLRRLQRAMARADD